MNIIDYADGLFLFYEANELPKDEKDAKVRYVMTLFDISKFIDFCQKKTGKFSVSVFWQSFCHNRPCKSGYFSCKINVQKSQ